jgi:hypothetical protein
MTDLLDAVRDELRAREQRRDDLVAELAGVDRDVEQLTRISELATSLNGNGAVETPAPDQPSGGRAKPARQTATEKGRNGGEAPGRSPAGGAGSAPSGQAKHAPPSTSKRATILAYVQEHGETKVADIAAAMDMSHAKPSASTSRHCATTATCRPAARRPRACTSARPPAAPQTPPPSRRSQWTPPPSRPTAVAEVLGRIDSAMHAKEIAYQATKDGTPVTEREASTILLDLERGGKAARFSGMGGRLVWRAAE